MTVHPITIEIDDSKLTSYSDEFLATCWHAAQHNPAGHGDYLAGELAEYISREIIRRWLRLVRPELWRHQGRDHFSRELRRFATYEPGGPTDLHDTLVQGYEHDFNIVYTNANQVSFSDWTTTQNTSSFGYKWDCTK